MERIQYKAAKLVTGALHFTSKDKLNAELGWESIKTRIDFLGLCLFQKIHLHLTRPLVRKCMSKIKEQDPKGVIYPMIILEKII